MSVSAALAAPIARVALRGAPLGATPSSRSSETVSSARPLQIRAAFRGRRATVRRAFRDDAPPVSIVDARERDGTVEHRDHSSRHDASLASDETAPSAFSEFGRVVVAATAGALVALAAPETSDALYPDILTIEPANASSLFTTTTTATTEINRGVTETMLFVPEGASTLLDPEETATVSLFKQNTPSVVFITNKQLRKITPYDLNATEIPIGAGSGFIWDEKGHVVTNFHVVRGASEVTVKFMNDPKEYAAKVLGWDEDKDIAVLEIKELKNTLRPLALGKSSSIEVGQKVFAIGNPFGLDHTLTTGVVSGVGREIPSNATGRPIAGVIQTDAAINPGNSGGPLLDSSGRLVGVNTAIASPSGAFSGVGFALPIDSVKGIVEQIIQFGRVTRPVMGLVLAPDGALPQVLGPEALRNWERTINSAQREEGSSDSTRSSRGIHSKVSPSSGVLVLGVVKDGPADRAGVRGTERDPATGDVRVGDVVVGLGETAVNDSSDLYKALDAMRGGDAVQVTVRRGAEGREVTLKMVLGEKITRFGPT
jgi:S1-C subfamily serine protease